MSLTLQYVVVGIILALCVGIVIRRATKKRSNRGCCAGCNCDSRNCKLKQRD
jgi:hypothetical protein